MNAVVIAATRGGRREGRDHWRCPCPLHGGRSLTLADGHPAHERRHRTLCRDRGAQRGHRGRQTEVLDARRGIQPPIKGTVHRYVQLPDRAAKANAT
jgi:hypothetical protein